MAKIPRIAIPVRTTTSQVPGRRISQGSATGDVLQTLGKAGQEIFAKIERASSFAENLKGSNQRDLAHTDIQTRAANDTDSSPANQKRYQNELVKANKDAAKHITIPAEKALFEQESETLGSISRAKIEGGFRKKILEEGAVNLSISMDLRKNQFIQAQGAREKDAIIAKRNDDIRRAVELGYIDRADAIKKVDELDKDFGKAQVEYDIATNPLMAREILKSKEYPNITELERVELLKKVDVEMRRISSELKDDLNTKLLNQELGVDEILASGTPREDGGIGGTAAKVLVNQLKAQQKRRLDDIYSSSADSVKYIDLIDEVLLSDIDSVRFREILVDAFADGVVDDKENERLRKMKDLLGPKRFRDNHPIIAGIPVIKNFFGANNPDQKDLAVAIRNYLKEVDEGKAPANAVNDILNQEYNSIYPDIPLQKDEKALDNTREREISFLPALKRMGSNITVGIVGTVKGAGEFFKAFGGVEAKVVGELISQQADKVLEKTVVPDPNFGDKVAQGFGSMSTFFIPGLGVAKGVQIASFAPRMALWVGSSASAVLEGIVESGSTYQQGINKGFSDQEAKNSASKVFWANIPLLVITNRFGIFGDKGKVIGKAIVSSGSEGFQEFSQAVISNAALHDPLLNDALESAAIGAVVGGGTKLSVDTISSMGELQAFTDLSDKLKSEKGELRIGGDAVTQESLIAEAEKVKTPEEVTALVEKTKGFIQQELETEETTLETEQNIEKNLPTAEGKIDIASVEDQEINDVSFNVEQIAEFTKEERQRVLDIKLANAVNEIHRQNIINKYGADITTPPRPPTESGQPFDENFYERNRNINRAKPKKLDFVKTLEEFFTPISSRLARINPELRTAITKFEFKLSTQTLKDETGVIPLLESTKTMSPEDASDFDLARKNGDVNKIDEIVTRYGIDQQNRDTRKILDDINKRAKEVKMDIGYIENYHPRVIKDVEGFINAFRKGKSWSVIQEAIDTKETEIGRYLTQEEKAYAINSLLRGYGVSNIKLSLPSGAKQRLIDQVTPELNVFYEESNTALMDYIRSMNDSIESRRFFGKNEGSIDNSIGAFTMKLMSEGKITPTQEIELRDILQARFNAKGTTGVFTTLKNLSYIDTMGSPISAITQLGDTAWAVYRNGFYLSGKSFITAVSGKSKINKTDLGIERISEEFKDKSKSAKAVKKVFDGIGLTWMDNLGKETLINSSIEKLRRDSKNPSERFREDLDILFGEEVDQVLEDLKAGETTENVKLLAFSELSDFQPISLSEMPQKYLSGGNGRLFYMLKSFTIKQIDIFRRESFDLIAKGQIAKGLSNLIRLGSAFIIANASADTVKNLVLGRPMDFDDLVWDNILRMVGFSKFQIYKARVEGVGSAFYTSIRPPTKLIDSISKDSAKIANSDLDGLENLETIQSLPFIGKLYYWWFGKGRSKIERKSKRSRTKRKRKRRTR